ncbi:hypothetical protein [Spirosoma panaciterrae]|uniref:hypothetical protein n=1 Tax=Spirosoma panaciterrae TaxID=496058 RepID=UPI000368DD5B|nr:hypothetical protein [Spirosoma panaciterrae]
MKYLLTLTIIGLLILQTSPTDAKSQRINKYHPVTGPLFQSGHVGVFELSFKSNGMRHHGLMLLRNGVGVVRIQFYSVQRQRQETVEELIECETTTTGALMLACYKPVYAGSSVRHATYAPDNFILWKENGRYRLTNVDDSNQVAEMYFRSVESESEQRQLLRQFGW